MFFPDFLRFQTTMLMMPKIPRTKAPPTAAPITIPFLFSSLLFCLSPVGITLVAELDDTAVAVVFNGLTSLPLDWCEIPVAAVRVDNFVVWLCEDDRNEETDCGTRNDPVLEITTVKDGDGDSADDVNNTGDDTGWYNDLDDWPVIDDGDSTECVVGIYDGDDDRDGDDIDEDDDNEDDISTVSGKVDEETEGSWAS